MPLAHESDDNPFNYVSLFPGLSEACDRLGIVTPRQLARRVYPLTNGQWPFHKVLRRCADLGDGTVNPWNAGRQLYHPFTAYLAKALGRHPCVLFGSSRDLQLWGERPHEQPTQQRDHIRALITSAGLTDKDILSQGSVAQLRKANYLCRVYDSCSSAQDGAHFRAFNPESGKAHETALDLAAILDMPVEDVFKIEAEDLANRGLPLPLYRPLPLDHARNVAIDNAESPNDLSLNQGAVNNLGLLQRHESHVLCLRLGINVDRDYTLKEIGDMCGVSPERIRQIEQKALSKLRMWEKRFRPDTRKVSDKSTAAKILATLPHPLGDMPPATEYIPFFPKSRKSPKGLFRKTQLCLA